MQLENVGQEMRDFMFGRSADLEVRTTTKPSSCHQPCRARTASFDLGQRDGVMDMVTSAPAAAAYGGQPGLQARRHQSPRVNAAQLPQSRSWTPCLGMGELTCWPEQLPAATLPVRDERLPAPASCKPDRTHSSLAATGALGDERLRLLERSAAADCIPPDSIMVVSRLLWAPTALGPGPA